MMRTRNQGLGNGLPDLLRSAASAGGAKIIVRSNLTPDITIDLAQLMKPGEPASTAVQSPNTAVMQFIKPEVEVTGLGVSKTFSPHGRPTAGMFTVLAAGAAAMATLGGLIAWKICRG